MSLTLYPLPYKIELVDLPSTILPGFPLNLTVQVSSQDGSPLGDGSPTALKVEHGFVCDAGSGVVYSKVPSNGRVVLPFVAQSNPKIAYDGINVTFKVRL